MENKFVNTLIVVILIIVLLVIYAMNVVTVQLAPNMPSVNILSGVVRIPLKIVSLIPVSTTIQITRLDIKYPNTGATVLAGPMSVTNPTTIVLEPGQNIAEIPLSVSTLNLQNISAINILTGIPLTLDMDLVFSNIFKIKFNVKKSIIL